MIRTSTVPKAVTLFSGVGGSSKALRDLGFWVYAHDFNADACASLKANGFKAFEGDVREIDWSHPRYVDTVVLEGGPPCQPFSQSHDGDGHYDPRDMIPEFLRAIDGLRPELFVMEEVQTLTWKKHRDYFEMVLDHMRTLGYLVDWRILDSSDYGIGQKRRRLIVVGKRLDLLPNDWQNWADCPGLGILWPAKVPDFARVTMAEALGWTSAECWYRNQQVPDERAHVDGFDDKRHLWPLERAATTVVGSFRPEVHAAPGYRKAGDPPRQATPGSVVTTLEERLVLQDFPRDWIVCGKPASRDLQVGNSVPVGMMRRVIEVNL
jgi:DNA-cytosine methyltransferase